jgi:hypothetical protein
MASLPIPSQLVPGIQTVCSCQNTRHSQVESVPLDTQAFRINARQTRPFPTNRVIRAGLQSTAHHG